MELLSPRRRRRDHPRSPRHDLPPVARPAAALRALVSLTALLALLAGCSTEPSIRYTDSMFEPEPAGVQYGIASWYHANWIGIGEQTASGERFRQYDMTAAHKTLPLGTFVRVTNLGNGSATIARITDRGPYVAGRIIDLSKTGARDLGILDSGIARVKLEVLVPRRTAAATGYAARRPEPVAYDPPRATSVAPSDTATPHAGFQGPLSDDDSSAPPRAAFIRPPAATGF